MSRELCRFDATDAPCRKKAVREVSMQVAGAGTFVLRLCAYHFDVVQASWTHARFATLIPSWRSVEKDA